MYAYCYLVLREHSQWFGGDSEEVTPVPMPNTAVKLFCVNGSWGLPPARVERCRAYILFHSSSVVEQSAVNRSVVGSSPTCGAIASIAQQVEHFHGKEEVSGSSPLGSLLKFKWPLGQVVKTPPFHGGNTSSNLVGVTIWRISSAGRASALQAEGRRFDPVILHHLFCRPSSIGRATDL